MNSEGLQVFTTLEVFKLLAFIMKWSAPVVYH